jgi:hypothetical protein
MPSVAEHKIFQVFLEEDGENSDGFGCGGV